MAQSKKILIVEDEEAIRHLMVLVLEKTGYEVIQAEDGLDALRHYETHGDDLAAAVIDWSMPHMTGDELFRRMLDIHPAPPVVFCSGYDSPVFESSLGPGNVFLKKPYRPQELIEALEHAIDEADSL